MLRGSRERRGCTSAGCGEWKSSVSVHTANGFASDNIFLSSALTIICLLFSPAMFYLQQSLRNLIKINVNDGGLGREMAKKEDGNRFQDSRFFGGSVKNEDETQGHNLTYGNFTEIWKPPSNDPRHINRKSSLKF